MISIALEILTNWVLMGIAVWICMIGFLYFAVVCEKIADTFATAK